MIAIFKATFRRKMHPICEIKSFTIVFNQQKPIIWMMMTVLSQQDDDQLFLNLSPITHFNMASDKNLL